jgi:hypothetical protein
MHGALQNKSAEKHGKRPMGRGELPALSKFRRRIDCCQLKKTLLFRKNYLSAR